MSRAAAIGMFDGVHLGHRFLLDYIKGLTDSDLRPLAVTFANHPLEVVRPEGAPQLLTLADEKAALLTAAGADVAMLDFDEPMRRLSAREFMAMLRDRYDMTTLVMGFNNRFGHDRGLEFEDYRRLGSELGIEVSRAPEFVPENGAAVSSTAIRRLIAEGDVAAAARLLGYAYTLSGTVVGGNRIGRTLGFPTANLQPSDPRKLIPAPGVYAAEALTADGRTYPAMVNIGHRPTVDNVADLRIEAYLHGFEGDLYGQPLTLLFHARLRDERRFPTLAALRAQLAKDLEIVTKTRVTSD